MWCLRWSFDIYDACDGYCDIYDVCDEYYDIYDACDESYDIYDTCDEYYGMRIMLVIFGYFYTWKKTA
jgi:hypothetical protein